MNRRTALQLAAGALIAAACLYFFFRNTDFAALGDALRRANYWWLLVAFGFALLSLVARTWRWQVLLLGAKRVSFRASWTPTALGFMSNALLPARAGELIRIVTMTQRERIPFTTVLASLIMARFADTLMVVFVGILVFTVLPIDATAFDDMGDRFPFTVDQVRHTLGVVMGGTAILGLTALGLLYYRREQAERLLRRALFFLPHALREKIIGLLETFTAGMHVMRSGRQVAFVLFQSALVWGAVVMTFPFIFEAFGIREELPVHAPLIMTACACIGVLVPTPGYLGAYQIAMALGLALCSREVVATPGAVEAFGIVAWTVTFIPVVSAGFFTLLAEGVSLGALKRQAEAEAAAHEGEAPVPGEGL